MARNDRSAGTLKLRVITSFLAWIPWVFTIVQANGEPVASVIAVIGFVVGVLPLRWLVITGPLQLAGLGAILVLVSQARGLDTWLWQVFFGLHLLSSATLCYHERRQRPGGAQAPTPPADRSVPDMDWVRHDCGGPDVDD